MNYLVVGLGNIGQEYSSTRHNMGFMTLDAWSEASNVPCSVERYGSVAQVSFKGRNFILLKPSTYMNLSGKAVRYWMDKLSIPLERVIVITDDLNLPFGTLRMRKAGSDGGHNGLRSIQECLETTSYPRIRIGIGHDFHEGEQIDYVLGNLSEEEKAQVAELTKKVIAGIKTFALVGADMAMNQVNTKPKPKNESQE